MGLVCLLLPDGYQPMLFGSEQLHHRDVYMSYLPLAHIFDRAIEECFIFHGASIGFWRGVSVLLKSSLATSAICSCLFIAGCQIIN